MKKRRILLTLAVTLWLAGMVGIGGLKVQAAQPEKTVEETALESEGTSFFQCSVTDQNGNLVFGYPAPQDGIVYLFLPHTVEISDLQVQCAGEIRGVSRGEWDPAAGVLRSAFQKSGDTVTVQLADGEVRIRALQSDLPSIQLELNQTTLQTVQSDKNIKYPGNSVYLTNVDKSADVTAENCVELKGRGNSSWQKYEKKGYQIKFSEKTSVLGMPAAKKWILLANASDDSMVRNMTAMELSRGLDMAYTTRFQYADLWIDGDYQGTYLVGEKVEIGENRISLTDAGGVVMEEDAAFYMEEDHYFYDALLDTHFTVKESVSENEEEIASAMTSFQQAVDALMLYLYQTPSDQVTTEALSAMIDVDSFAKYYLITEYALNREANNSSFYWYRDGEGDVLHLGPVWDFDTCMGNEDLGADQYFAHFYNPLMNRLLAAPAFYDRVCALKTQYRSVFAGLAGTAERFGRQIDSSAYMNYIRWNTLGGVNPKGYSDFSATYRDSISGLKSWLNARYKAFAVQRPRLDVRLSEDGTKLIVSAGRKTNRPLTLAVWSSENGQDDLQWYPVTRVSDGEPVFEIDLAPYESLGVYLIHLYEGNGEEAHIIDASLYDRLPPAL